MAWEVIGDADVGSCCVLVRTLLTGVEGGIKEKLEVLASVLLTPGGGGGGGRKIVRLAFA